LQAIAFVVAAAAPAQERADVPTLHEAWLHEVMDLDVGRAVAAYRQVAAHARTRHNEPWVPAARLTELHRLGAAPTAPDPGDVPPPLRATFQSAQTMLPVDELRQRTRGEPKAVLQRLGSDAGRLPELHSVVPATEDWVMSQIGPSLRDRWRQRMAAFSNRARGTTTAGLTERIHAADILRAELQGRTPQADALRQLYFADWSAPAATGDPTAHVARIRQRLQTMLADADLPPSHAAMLRELAEAIEQRAATNPAAALTFVLRLPLYADRLLQADAPAQGR
jgi:hypothetical protein